MCIIKKQNKLGFSYRSQDELDILRKLRDLFDYNARDFGSELLGIPSIVPIKTFIGNDFRPLTEKHSGRLARVIMPCGEPMANIYEGTAPVAEFAVSKLNQGYSDWQCHYTQEMVRLEESRELDKRHKRSFYQYGYEVFTKNPSLQVKNFANMLLLNNQFFQKLGLNPKFRISHTSLVANYLKSKGLAPFKIKRISGLMEDSSLQEIETGLKECGVNGPIKSTMMILAESREISLAESLDVLYTVENEVGNVSKQFIELIKILASEKIIENCYFDGGINRSLNFYNGFSLQIDTDNNKEVAGGGAYTGMLETFDSIDTVYACGSAIGIERLIDEAINFGSLK